MPAGRTITLLWLLLVLARPAAAARTDVIVLANGDRLTGEVKTLSRGQVQVKTDDLGTVSIEWDKIAALTTAGRFDIATRNGLRLVGSFGPPPAGATGAGIVKEDGTTVSMPFLEIVSFAAIRSSFFEKIDGSMDVGASYTQSSGVAQASFEADAAYRQPSFEASTALSMSLTRTPDSPDTARYSLSFGYTRFHARRWLTQPLVLIESNPDLGFDLRTTAAISLGRFVVQSNRATVQVGAGVAVGRELPVGESATTNVDGLIGLSMSVYSYDYPKTTIDLSVLTFPSLKDLGRIRVNANAKLKRELLKDFFVAVTAYNAYDNQPPVSDVNHNDVGFSLSLGWTF